MKRQKGLATLLVTTMILVVSLLFSLASYKNVFYQIKRTQNEVLSRKAHWLAEGGLECGYTVMQLSSTPKEADKPGFFPSECNSKIGVSLSAVKKGGTADYELTSMHSGRANATLRKTVRLSGSGTSGAIQTGSNMYANSSLVFNNPDPGEFTGAGWQCVALRYRGVYKPKAAIVNHGLRPPPNGKDCLASHKTNGTGFSALKNDFVHDPDFSPFESFFDVSDENHNKVRAKEFDVILEQASSPVGNNQYKSMKDCGTKIKDALTAGHDAIWVEGHCEISGENYEEIVKSSNTVNGAMILVHDGMFSIFPKKVKGNLKYQGVIFHYNLDYKYNFSDWRGSEAISHLNHKPSNFEGNEKLASYYLHGALNLNGGLILDAKHYDEKTKKYISQNALLNDSFAMTYNGSYFKKFGKSGNRVSWLEGSWHDF